MTTPSQSLRDIAAAWLRERGFPSSFHEADAIEAGEWDHHSCAQALHAAERRGLEYAAQHLEMKAKRYRERAAEVEDMDFELSQQRIECAMACEYAAHEIRNAKESS